MKYLIALLTAATGIMHLLVGFHLIAGGGSGPGTNWLLVLNGIGYLVLLVLFWRASGNGGTIRWILLAYTLITLFGYFFMGAGFAGGTTPLVIKAIELLLAILLLLYRGPEPAVSAQPAIRAATPKVDSSAADLSGVGSRAGGAAVDLAGDASAAATAAAVGISATADRTGDAVAAVADDAVDAAGDAASDVADAAGDAVDTASDVATDLASDVADAAGDAVDAASDAASGVTDVAGDAVDAAAGAASDVADAAGDAVDAAGDAIRGGAAAVASAADDAVEAVADAVDGAQTESEPHGEDFAAELREYFRTSFGSGSEYSKPIEYIEGIGAVYGQKLRAIDISTVLDLIVNGATRRGRKDLSDRSGISPSLILTWVNHVDLFRIKGVAQEYADLLEEAGVDTVVELAKRNPANLHKRMIEVNEQKALVRRTPHASEVVKWIDQAKELRRVIHY